MTIKLLPRITVDLPDLLDRLLAYPGLEVKPRTKVDSLSRLPMLAHIGGNGHLVRNGYPGAGWEWTLFLTVWTADIDRAADLTDTIYQLVHGMEGRSVDGVGGVVTVEDVSMFDQIATATLQDKRVAQYDATFTVVVTPA